MCLKNALLATLEELLERSLIVATNRGETKRFSMVESLREFAAMRSEPEIRLAAKHNHADYYLCWCCEVKPGDHAMERRAWMRSMDDEHNNILDAIEQVQGTPNEVRFAACLWRYWELRGYIEPGIRLIERALLVDVSPTPERAGALHGLGALRDRKDDVNGALEAFNQSQAIYGENTDTVGHARVLNNLALLLEKRGELDAAHDVAFKCLEMTRSGGNTRDIAACLNTLGRQRRFVGDREGALVYLQEALDRYERIEDWDSAAVILNNIGYIASDLGDLPNARAAFERSLAMFRDIEQPAWTAFALHNVGDTKLQQGDAAGAQLALFEALDIRTRLTDRSGVAMTLETLAAVANADGDTVRAVQIVAAASALRRLIDTPMTPASLPVLEQQISNYKRTLMETDFEAAWSFGTSMSLESAVLYAREGRLLPRQFRDIEQDTRLPSHEIEGT